MKITNVIMGFIVWILTYVLLTIIVNDIKKLQKDVSTIKEASVSTNSTIYSAVEMLDESTVGQTKRIKGVIGFAPDDEVYVYKDSINHNINEMDDPNKEFKLFRIIQ